MALHNRTVRVPDGEADCYPNCGDDDIVVGQPVFGCTDETACNYWASATVDNGSCFYQNEVGCSNPMAMNYDANSQGGTGLCVDLCTYDEGCTDETALTYSEGADYAYNVLGIVESNVPEMCVFDNDEDIEVVEGCTNSDAENYNELANLNDGSCTFSEEFYAPEDDEVVVEDEEETFGARASKFVEDNKVLLGVLAVAVVGYIIYKRR